MKKFFEYLIIFLNIAGAGYIFYSLTIPDSDELKQARAGVKANLDWFESQGLLIKKFLAEPTGVYQPGYPNSYNFYSGQYYDYNFNKEKLNKLVELFKEDAWNELPITVEMTQTVYSMSSLSITENSIVLCKNNTGIVFHMFDVKDKIVFESAKIPNTFIEIVYDRFFPCYGRNESKK
ncbi:hypothetical protein VH441_08320 [Psychrobacter sp. HD31]|uniref:hypothetical protein n=1 Tax=Psychrobacter sp. HD31 TaxID=3112003 RepID=UPI003DA5A828